MPTKQEIRHQWECGGPVVVWSLIAACVIVWLVEVVLGFLSPILQSWFISVGMVAPSAVMRMPWTLLTSMFLHAPNSILHILFNMLALYAVGPVLERMLGHWRFLGLYVISGLGGTLGLMVWAVLAPDGQGWQGAAYGASVINFLLPFVVGGVAWQAHVGGFVVGGALAWLLVAGIPAWRGKSLAWRMRVYGGTMTVLVIALIALCNLANPYSALF